MLLPAPRRSPLRLALLLAVLGASGPPSALRADKGKQDGPVPSLAAARRRVEEKVEAICTRDALAGSTIGVLVRRVSTGAILCARRPRALLPPASTAKLVSCGGALAALGADFRFTTPVVRTGDLEDGVLKGDLVFVGSGDPNLSQRVTEDGRLRFEDHDHTYAGFAPGARVVPGDPAVVLKNLARDVRQAGVREVRGDVVVDDGLFAEHEDSLAGALSAVCVGDNVVDITVYPGADPGDPAEVDARPELDAVRIDVSAETGPPGSSTRLRVERRDGVAAFAVRGSIPVRSRPLLRVGRIADPARAAAVFLRECLIEAGVAVQGTVRTARFGPAVYRRYPVVARHVSPPLDQSLRVCLKVSHNLHAAMLPLAVGAYRGERGTRAEGFRVIRARLEAAGVDTSPVVLGSGSGGGRADRVSAEFLVELLLALARRDDFPALWSMLPVSGVDGTLAGHLRTPDLRGRVRAKTGTLVYRGELHDRWIYLSKALAGYIDLRDEEPAGPADPEDVWAFAVLIANTVCSSRDEGVDLLFRAQEDILRAVVEEAPRERRESPPEKAREH